MGEFNDQIYYALIISCFLTSLVFLRKDAHALLQCGALSSITERNYLLSFGLINLAKNNYFLQLGLGNLATKYSTIQIGAVNTGSLVQFGIVNAFGKIQFGLLNYNPDAWIKWMPFFNFSSSTAKADTSLAASERPPHE